MRTIRRVTNHVLPATLAVLASGQARASEPLFDCHPGAIEAEIEAVLTPWDSGGGFDDLDPLMLFGARGAVYLGQGLNLGAGVRTALSDPEAEHLEAVASFGWTWISSPRLSIPPAMRVAVRVEAGWRWLELLGSDFVVQDDGPIGAITFDIGLVPMRSFAIVARLGAAFAEAGAEDVMQAQGRFGVAVVGVF